MKRAARCLQPPSADGAAWLRDRRNLTARMKSSACRSDAATPFMPSRLTAGWLRRRSARRLPRCAESNQRPRMAAVARLRGTGSEHQFHDAVEIMEVCLRRVCCPIGGWNDVAKRQAGKSGSANGNRTRILALKGLRANRCTIAPQYCRFSSYQIQRQFEERPARRAGYVW